MKLAILGGIKKGAVYYEAERILYEALKAGHEAVFLSKSCVLQTDLFGGKFEAYFKPPTIAEQFQTAELFSDVKPLRIRPDPEQYGLKVPSKTLGFISSTKTLPDWYKMTYFDAILVREVGKTLEWTYTLLNYLAGEGTTIVDHKLSEQLNTTSKIVTFYKFSRAGWPYPRSISLAAHRHLKEVLELVTFPVIVKKSNSSQGRGVYRCQNAEEVQALFKNNPDIVIRDCLIQEYIDFPGDIRVFVVGNEILGAMRRTPQAGQWKGNVHQGALAEPYEINSEIRELVETVLSDPHRSEILGVDVMLGKNGPVIIETNRSPQFAGFEQSTGINVAGKIIEYIANKVTQSQKAA